MPPRFQLKVLFAYLAGAVPPRQLDPQRTGGDLTDADEHLVAALAGVAAAAGVVVAMPRRRASHRTKPV